MRALLLLPALLLFTPLHAQQVLHFTATSGFDHGTRQASFALFTDIGAAHGWTIVGDDDGHSFDSPATLAQFDAVIFSNTSGDQILDAAQRANFEQWAANGGHVLGIHAATDTYRHSTANGNNTGTWDFYAELIGASVQESPNHVAGTPPYSMQHIGTHASTAHLPDPWLKHEEFYYWEGGYFGPDNTVVLEVEQTVGPNGEVNSYDAPRPMSWYRELPNGSRVFCTALGHAVSNYTEDTLFRQHVLDALVWLLGSPAGMEAVPEACFRMFPNPGSDVLHIVAGTVPHGTEVVLTDMLGRTLVQTTLRAERTSMPVHQLPAASYMVQVGRSARPFIIRP